MDFAKGLFPAKGIPRGSPIGFLVAGNEAFGCRIGQKKQIPNVQTEYLRELGHYFFGRMALSSFKMANVWNGRADPVGKLLLRQVDLASARANYAAKLSNEKCFQLHLLA